MNEGTELLFYEVSCKTCKGPSKRGIGRSVVNMDAVMSMGPSLLSLEPSIENCDPLALHQMSTPGEFSLQENPVLYGGGRKWIMECSDLPVLYSLVRTDSKEVDLYALNSCFVIWFSDCDYGLQVPYQLMTQHSVIKPGSKLQLYMKVCFSEASTLEFSFTPKFGEDDRYYNQSIEKLFTYEYFGLNTGDKMVYSTFGAIAKCLSLHIHDDFTTVVYDEMDYDSQDSEVDWEDNTYDNSGNADDMDCNYQFYTNVGDACVGVDINDGYRGMRRGREETDLQNKKRIRC